MLRFCQSFLLVAALSTAIAFPTALKAQNQEQPRVMLVLDGSSSMWTRVNDEVSKIEIAKNTIAELVGGWESKMEFGITTYGHREESNCQDIETVLPVTKVDGQQVINVINSIMPKGKTPLAAALRQAAAMLDYEDRPAKILLVSDGIENCGQDPCQAAANLAAEAKDLTIDIIGFDMNNHQMGQLECIATNANGHMVRADVSDFAEAMGHSMTAMIEDDVPRVGLSLSTTLVHKPVTKDVRYVVYGVGDDDEFSPKVAESLSVTPTFWLPAGKFIVEAIRGEGASTLSKSIEIDLVEGVDVDHKFRLADFRPPAR